MITRFQSVRVTPPKMEEGRTTERALLWISRAAGGSLFYEYQQCGRGNLRDLPGWISPTRIVPRTMGDHVSGGQIMTNES